ncbi:ABC transporter permease [Treponema sp.]|uniref:ABC transporter permease n=1 Tax=Treponema sp. TaxID=166 RepID=UPI00298D8678|nr:ABC transporter permease [Treponema sp.]
MIKDFSWINFVNKRFSMVDSKGRSAVTTRLSTIGICFGVMTLITVLSVMNGFQLQFIDSIIELSSYHVQVALGEDVAGSEEAKNREETQTRDKVVDCADFSELESYLKSDKNVVSFVPFREAQGLMTDNGGKEAGCLIRSVPEDVLSKDPGFKSQMKIVSGDFDISGEDSIVLGIRLARSLGVRTGSRVNIFALSGSGDTSLISNDRTFTVTGIFSCGYADINAAYAFINQKGADKYFGNAETTYGIKLLNQSSDLKMQKELLKKFPDYKVSVWRDYNRSFFGALRVEKNILLLLVVMIFIVVAINIYNSMRKLVYERRTEISTLASLGGSKKAIRNVFIIRGLSIGIKGSVSGMILALIISFNIKKVFFVISKIQYFFTWISSVIFNPAAKELIRENPMWNVYANIPARVFAGEVVFITLFGIFSCLFSSWIASSNILKLNICEVLHEQ